MSEYQGCINSLQKDTRIKRWNTDEHIIEKGSVCIHMGIIFLYPYLFFIDLHSCMLSLYVLSHSVVSDSLRPVDCSPPSSSVHGILQARILEWVAISFSRGSSRPRDRTRVSRIVDRHLSILKEISPEYSLEGLMLKLKLQYFGHLMSRTDSFEKTLMLGKI